MGTIARYAKGALSLLSLQTSGEVPRALADFVTPIADFTPNYLVEVQEAISQQVAAPANGFNSATLIVPQGEVWKLLHLSVAVVSAAGMTGTVAAAVRTGPAAGTNAFRFVVGDTLAYIASQTRWCRQNIEPIWCPAGYDLGCEITDQAGGAATVTVTALIQRLRA